MRLNRFVAQASGLSRRAADAAIAAGRVRIDDAVAQATSVYEPNQKVMLDGITLAAREEFRYYAMHKPVGFVCSRTQQGSDPTIYELVPAELQHLRSVGRLDRDSSGLLLLSDDGDYIHRHLHPSFGKVKRYEVGLARPLSPEDVRLLEAGVVLSDGPSRLTLVAHRGSMVTVTLEEGRNRQIRRTFTAIGNEVVTLHRTAFGSVTLGELATGEIRPLSEVERAW